MNSHKIWQRFERDALAWGKRHNRVHIGDIVHSKLAHHKVPHRFIVESVKVVIGRSKRITTRKSFTLRYCGRRLYRNGLAKTDAPCYVLDDFVTETGVRIHCFNGVDDTENDCGLSFSLEVRDADKKAYPLAYKTYADADYPYQY